jgi:hypothetical protein
MLQDNNFRWLLRVAPAAAAPEGSRPAEYLASVAQPYLELPCGIIRGRVFMVGFYGLTLFVLEVYGRPVTIAMVSTDEVQPCIKECGTALRCSSTATELSCYFVCIVCGMVAGNKAPVAVPVGVLVAVACCSARVGVPALLARHCCVML